MKFGQTRRENEISDKMRNFVRSNWHGWIWISLATFLIGAFVITSSEVEEAASGQVEFIGALDQLATSLASEIRNPHLSSIATDVTALGSGTVIAIFVAGVAMLLCLRKRFFEVTHLLVATFGSGILTMAMKSYFERPRPNGLSHLVNVQGYSYPSGHSLASSAVYFTFAILLFFYFRSKLERIVVMSFALLFISVIALSRVYLGVHYLSDVIAGVMAGIAWASILAAGSIVIKSRREHHATQ